MSSDSQPVRSASQEAFAGVCAGIVGTTLGFPLDTIKTTMQTSQSPLTETVRNIHKQHGFKGFYRGVGSPLVSLTVLNALNFTSYGYFCRQLNLNESTLTSDRAFEWKFGLAAVCVSPLASLISTPFELVKTKQQLAKKTTSMPGQNNNKIIGGSIRIAASILKSEGIRGLYHAHVVNTFREMVFLSTYFLTYEHFKVYANQTLCLPSTIATAVSGGIAGAVGWFISFPLDNIKSNIQGASLMDAKQLLRRSAWQVGKDILQQKGILGLYAGVAPSIARAFIVSASRFSTYEFALTIIE